MFYGRGDGVVEASGKNSQLALKVLAPALANLTTQPVLLSEQQKTRNQGRTRSLVHVLPSQQLHTTHEHRYELEKLSQNASRTKPL